MPPPAQEGFNCLSDGPVRNIRQVRGARRALTGAGAVGNKHPAPPLPHPQPDVVNRVLLVRHGVVGIGPYMRAYERQARGRARGLACSRWQPAAPCLAAACAGCSLTPTALPPPWYRQEFRKAWSDPPPGVMTAFRRFLSDCTKTGFVDAVAPADPLRITFVNRRARGGGEGGGADSPHAVLRACPPCLPQCRPLTATRAPPP